MGDLKDVKRTILVLCLICLTVVSCQDVVQKNETKTVDLQDPAVDGTVKSALENGSVSEVVVRKDLLLFPVNAPNLVIAHRQEIHAVPQTNGSNETDGKPTGAQVAEVNEYSLSQVVSTNDTDNQNETAGGSVPLSSSPFSSDAQNSTVLAPGKLLEIPSGFNLTDGLATEKVPLPAGVQNISVPKQSIVDILSKSLAQQETTLMPSLPTSSYEYAKRSVDSAEEDGFYDGDFTGGEQSDSATGNTTEIVKRSADSDESVSGENDGSSSSSTTTTEGSASSSTDSVSTSTEVEKRSVESSDDGDDDSTTNSTEYYDHEVKRHSKRHDNSTSRSSSQPNEEVDPWDFGREKESLRGDSAEDMDVAEDIVFRPLFRYRQETQLKQQSSGNRRRAYGDYDDDYANQDKGDYD